MSHHIPTSVVFALRLDGRGGAEKLKPGCELPADDVWMHLDYSSPHAYEWIKTSPLLPDGVRDSLQGDSSRPKLVKANGGMLLTLRCINATEGQRPDQMVALRFYISERIIVSTRRRRVPAVDEIMQDLAKNMGPLNTADWLVDLCEHITEQAGDFIDELQEKIAVLEEHLLSERTMDRVDLADIRRRHGRRITTQVGQRLRADATQAGHRHAVQVAGRGYFVGVEIRMRVQPQHAQALAGVTAMPGHGGDGTDPQAMVATEHDGHAPQFQFGHGGVHQLAIPGHHLVQMAIAMVRRLPGIDRTHQVATIHDVHAARSQCLGQSGNTQSIRPHARTAITGTDIRGYANQ